MEWKKIGRFQDYWYLPDNFHNSRYGHSGKMRNSCILGTDGDTGLVYPIFFTRKYTFYLAFYRNYIPKCSGKVIIQKKLHQQTAKIKFEGENRKKCAK